MVFWILRGDINLKTNRKMPNRKSTRLKGYDYSQPGGYFVTITIQNNVPILGTIVDAEVHLSPIGIIVRDEWIRTELVCPYVPLGEYVIMPNHLHGIIILNEREQPWISLDQGFPNKLKAPRGPAQGSLGAIIGQFKSVSTKRVNQFRSSPGRKLWQRNYFDRIIRNEVELVKLRKFIYENPFRWINSE